MKKIIILFSLIVLFIFALVFVRPVFAHGNQPRLEISAERLNPGDTLQLRGVDFEYDQEVAVELVDSTTHVLVVSVGNAVTDIEGVFIQNIILPADLPEGNYALRAIAYDHEIFSPPFTVWGTLIQGEESNVARDQSDVQLESVTAIPRDIVPTLMPQAIPPAKPVVSQNQNLIIIFALLGVTIFIIFGISIVRKR